MCTGLIGYSINAKTLLEELGFGHTVPKSYESKIMVRPAPEAFLICRCFTV